ncbi:MAG: alpha/beta fold hydrolase [Minicystis sp.]
MSLLDHPALDGTIFFPRPDFEPPPPGARDLMLAVAPGVRLHARLHDAPGAVAALVLFHGNGEVVSDYDAIAPDFARAGASLAVVDFRGYGRSEGTPTMRHLLADARPALAALLPELGRGGRTPPVVVMGRSLGSACAAELVRVMPEALAGIVFESGFSDLTTLALRRGIRISHADEEDLEVLCPIRKLRPSRTPLLVLHGARDTLIAPSEGRAVFEASGAADKRFVLVPDRGHNDLSLHPLYWQELGAFVQRVAAAAR